MDTWPADTRPPASQAQVAKGKGKEWQADSKRPGYLHLKQGQTGPVTLVEQGERLVWKSLVSDDNRRRLIARDISPVFPATRATPLKPPKRSIQQVAQSNVDFLRNYFPDLYVMDGLLQAELIDDAEHIKRLQDFNPHVGNLLDLVIRQDTTSRKLLWLAFPSGETGCDLNLSPFKSGSRIPTTFQPTVEPYCTFETPIQQIVSSPPLQTSKQSTTLGVRTFNSTTIYDFKAFTTNRTLKLLEVAKILPADTAGQEIVDFHLISTSHEATMVTESGSVYSYTHAKGGKDISLLFENASAHAFHRLATSMDDKMKLWMNEKELKMFDMRTPNTNVAMHTIADIDNNVFTSVENERDDWLVRACSTSQLLWFDRRSPGRTVLGYSHGRQRDRTLQVKTLDMRESGTLTFLSSKKNSMITVYDVSRNNTDLINVLSPPHTLSRSSSSEGSIGEAYLNLPDDTRDQDVCIYRLSERGSIDQYALGWSDEKEFPKPKAAWTEELTELERASHQPRKSGEFHTQENSEVNLWPIYEDVFIVHEEHVKREEEESADATYNLVEDAAMYWQSGDEPAEHLLTSYDVLFRSGEEPKHPSRADFLTGTKVNSKRGFRALSQGRLNVGDLGDGAMWSHNLLPTLNTFDEDISSNIQQTMKALHRYDLKPSDSRTPASLRLESDAREQLAMDLTLSSNIFSARDISKRASEKDDGGLETLTETLSLNSELPSLEFQYLRPIAKGLKGDEQMFPIGVRSLLQEWEVGADPEKYVLPPLTDSDDSDHQVSPTRITFAASSLVPSARPPVIATTFGPRAGRVPKPFGAPLVIESQPMADIRPTFTQASQPEASQTLTFSSTQILPGPYGGRPQVKKPVKKRVGGF